MSRQQGLDVAVAKAGGTVALFDRRTRWSTMSRRFGSDRGGELVECIDNSRVLMSGFGSEFVVTAS